MKRIWNQSAYQLASTALHQQKGIESIPKGEWTGLEAINMLPELLVSMDRSLSVNIFAITGHDPLLESLGNSCKRM